MSFFEKFPFQVGDFHGWEHSCRGRVGWSVLLALALPLPAGASGISHAREEAKGPAAAGEKGKGRGRGEEEREKIFPLLFPSLPPCIFRQRPIQPISAPRLPLTRCDRKFTYNHSLFHAHAPITWKDADCWRSGTPEGAEETLIWLIQCHGTVRCVATLPFGINFSPAIFWSSNASSRACS